jgi:hypothetical protein
MTSDGISSEDWDQIRALAVELANATDEDEDRVRHRLFERLRELTAKYGELPSILATEADYVDEPSESERLFLRAFELARARNDRANICEIALSLAELYAAHLRSVTQASNWLEVAGAYISSDNDMDRAEYEHIREIIGNLKKSLSG